MSWAKTGCDIRIWRRRGWYQGLSEAFLGFKGPKVLMLAGTDRLDRPLTIGQMQGRFQMVVLPQVQKTPPSEL